MGTRRRASTPLSWDSPHPHRTSRTAGSTSREASADWIAVTHQGGPARAFDPVMPAFEEAFDLERIERIVEFTGFEQASLRVLPQFQVSLSTRHHVRLNLGIGLPLMRREEGRTELGFYLLWDWFDGGLLEGW